MNLPNETGQFILELHLGTPVPFIVRERFAALFAVSVGVVDGWVNKGYLPTYTIGKYSFINLALLNQMVLKYSHTFLNN